MKGLKKKRFKRSLLSIVIPTLIISSCVGCITQFKDPIRKFLVYSENKAPKNYIIDRFRIKDWARGVYDINRNDVVDPGVDYFFFADGTGIWWLHNINYWNDNGKETDFSISKYPVKALKDLDGDGFPDGRYLIKPGSKIEHEGMKAFYEETQKYKRENPKKNEERN